MKILVEGQINLGLNGRSEIIISTSEQKCPPLAEIEDKIARKQFITVTGSIDGFEQYSRSRFYGEKKYTIPADKILLIF